MNMITDGTSWLIGQRNTYMASDVTLYADGDTHTISASVIDSSYDVLEAEGFTTVINSVDFITLAASLPREIMTGDYVVFNGQRYDAIKIGDKHSTHTDVLREEVRFHTKHMGAFE